MKLLSLRSFTSSAHSYYAICLVLLVAAAALRFYNLSEHSLWLDEAVVANNSRGTFWEVALYTRHRNSSPPLYPYMLWALQLVESSPFTIRFIPALASALTVAVFLLLLPIAGVSRAVAFIAGLLAALSPAAIEHARDAREYSVDALVAALLIVSLLLYLRDRKKLPLCATLFIAPTLQYGLALFSVAIIATAMIGVIWADFRTQPRSSPSNRLRTVTGLARNIFWPCACFTAGCAIALVTLSGQWDGSGWAASGYLQQSYYHGQPYNPVQVAEFVANRVWRMMGYHVWEAVVALALASCALILMWSWRRLRFDPVFVLFLLSIAVASCAALAKAYPLGDIRQNIYLGPIVFLAAGYTLYSATRGIATGPVSRWLAVAIVCAVAIGGTYNLTKVNPYQARGDIRQALAVLETHVNEGDAVYVGRYAAPIVQFYHGAERTGYFYGRCLFGSAASDEDKLWCARDIHDNIRVIFYQLSHADSHPERLFLLLHGEVSIEALDEIVGKFHDGEAQIVQVSSYPLYVIENFRQIAANLAPTWSEDDMGDLIISAEYNVYLDDDKLTYVNRLCNRYDTAATFFLHLAPVDTNDLPDERRNHGFDKLEFTFDENGSRDDKLCVTTHPLPDYGVKRIRTGQYVPLKFISMRVWESSWREILQ